MAVLLDGIAATFRADQNFQFTVVQNRVDKALHGAVPSKVGAAVQTSTARDGLFDYESRRLRAHT
jgi:hypothetical protein